MSPDVLRRKLQKKAKRKRFRKCPACGGRLCCRVRQTVDPSRNEDDDVIRCECEDRTRCKFFKEINWMGTSG